MSLVSLLSLVLSCLLSLSRGQWEGAACLSRGADKAATVGWRLTCVKAVRALTAMTDYRFVCLCVCVSVCLFSDKPVPYLHRYLSASVSTSVSVSTSMSMSISSLLHPCSSFSSLSSFSSSCISIRNLLHPSPHHVQRHALFQLPNNNSIPTHIYIYNF